MDAVQAPGRSPPAPDMRSFGERFLEQYERQAGSPSSFSFGQLQSIRGAQRADLLDLLRRLDVIGLSYAQIQAARGMHDPADLARVVLRQQRKGARALALAAGFAALGPLVNLLSRLVGG